MKTKIAYVAGALTLGGGLLAGCPEPIVGVDANVPDAPIVLPDTGGSDGGRDSGVRVDTNPAASCGTRGNIGGQCAAAECFSPAMCQEEVVGERPSVRRDGSGPGRPYPVDVYPGGICEQACDPNANGQCNACSTCLQTGTNAASGDPVGTCFMSCMQDLDGRGGCNEGYGCNRAYLACVPSCSRTATTDTCQYSFEDRDDDPTTNETIVDEGAMYPSVCNTTTGLCEQTGRAGATAGDDCMDDFDCEDDGLCISDDAADAPVTLQDGYCVRLGCNDTDLACQTGDVCTQSLFGLAGGVCMDGCTVGAETTDAQRYGVAGGNPGCGTGEACFWDGVHGTAATLNGGCYPGNYNDVPAYNVGSECQDDGDCWSPFGRGRCLFTGGTFFDRTGRGICAVGGCGVNMDGTVGLATIDGVVSVPDGTQICQGVTAGNNDQCVNFGDNNTFCVSGCTTANDCPTGWACPDLNDDPLRPLRLCWPGCLADGDCRTGAMCRNDSGGACNPMTDTCFCTDAVRAPDAGVVRDAAVARDAGTDAPAPADDAAAADDAASSPDAP